MTKSSTLELILAAAENEFLEKGYEDAALREIARKAGVTTGALYGYFKNKQELFGTLVEEDYNHMLAMYRGILDSFNTLAPEAQVESMSDYTVEGMNRMADYMYDHWTAFKLLLCCAQGTRYAHLVEEMAALDVQATDDFSQSSTDAGLPMNPVNPTLERMLTYSMFSNFFEMVRQDLPREEAEAYIGQLQRFYTAGWKEIMGF